VATVWILGAGASRAEHSAMPLVNDFMKIAFNLGRFNNPGGKMVLASIRDNLGYTEEQLRTCTNVEELLTFAACDVSWLDLTDPTAENGGLLARWVSTKLPETLEYLIASVLFQVQQEVFAKKETLHDALVKLMRTGDSVVSYNYDLVVDHALWKAGKASSADYGLQFQYSVDGAERDYSTLEAYQHEQSRGISLLKLHGSLNWLHIKHHHILERKDPFRALQDSVLYLRDGFEISLIQRQFGKTFILSCPSEWKADPGLVELTPVIIPPTFEKADAWKIRGGAIRELWSRALEAIQKCDRMVIIGHSLRDTDYQTRWLLRAALAKNAGRPKIAIVNKCDADRIRLHQFFESFGTVEEYPALEEYISEEQSV
jgi:SIR2-like domain